MRRWSFLWSLFFVGAFCIVGNDAYAGHCRKGTNSQKIRCLNSEVGYLTAKWKEALGEVRVLRSEVSALRDEIPGSVAAAFPRGTIFAWMRPEGVALPQGWAPCDGTNGLPNLNGKFLRGGANVGVEGGSENHTHKVANDGGRDGRGFAIDKSPSALGNTDEKSNLPPFMTVAFICKM